MERLNGFNAIAAWYDRLASLIFGPSIRYAQLHFNNRIPVAGKILVLGGGTGWHAAEIMQGRKLRMVYLDASEKMISIARQKLEPMGSVRFVHGTQSSLRDDHYDVIIANFYLD
ncbi:MAG TPA: class I SAM-dependent methyltransferase, partial [Chryseosolibacter sp.]|nr:class I SAM-dependent methyltransferase [Chryseosolibacter sp.]